MVSKRNRILNLENYLNSCGIEINIGKNKARGNKGFFKVNGQNFRIDIAKDQNEETIIKTLAHEFAHFVHYKYDKSLKSLNFVFDENDDDLLEELLNITVESIPKNSIEPLFTLKESLKKDINLLIKQLENICNIDSNFADYSTIEQKILKSNLKYLLKYDRVKVVEMFSTKVYTIEELDENTEIGVYLKLKSKQRALKRINSKISRLNKYYNSPTELFARSFELFVTDKNKLAEIAPIVHKKFEKIIALDKIKLLSDFLKNLNI